jgi:hypothetical protein
MHLVREVKYVKLIFCDKSEIKKIPELAFDIANLV